MKRFVRTTRPGPRAGVALVASLLLSGGAALAAATALPSAASAVAACATPWAEGRTYAVGASVSYGVRNYTALQAHTAYTGAGWNPAATPTLWRDVEACGGTTGPAPTPTATGTSTPRTTPTPTPTGTSKPTGGLPAKILTGYWQNFDNGATPLRLRDVPTSYDLIAVAFADATSTPGAVSFTLDTGLSSRLGGYTKADFINDVKTVHARGQKVVISIGGEKGNVDFSSAANASSFVTSMTEMMRDYGFDGIDIDLEHGLNVQNVASASRQLRNIFGASFVYAMAPQTVDTQPGGRYLDLIDLTKDFLTVVNTQYYNSGSMNGCNGSVVTQGTVDFITAQACYLLQKVNPDQVGLGFPATAQGAGSGYVSPSVVNAAVNCLTKRQQCGAYVPEVAFPGLRGVMDWSINWDATGGYAFASSVKANLTGTGGATTTPAPSPTPTSGGACATAAWNSSSVYTGGMSVSHRGRSYSAKWWTQGEEPGVTTSGVWADKGAC